MTHYKRSRKARKARMAQRRADVSRGLAPTTTPAEPPDNIKHVTSHLVNHLRRGAEDLNAMADYIQRLEDSYLEGFNTPATDMPPAEPGDKTVETPQ